MAMDEIIPGVFHWTAFHERIKQDVNSYFVADGSGTLIDPMVPAEGIEWLELNTHPGQIVLTNRHHYRHSQRFVEAFGCPVKCEESGLHEFEGDRPVEGFRFGEELSDRITALEVGAITPEDTALHIRLGDGALAFADAVIRYERSPGFVPDSLLGGDAEDVKRGVRASAEALLEHDFDALLFAHGEPLARGGRQALREFVERG